MVIVIDIPPPELSPNSRRHWSVRARLTRVTRTKAHLKAREVLPRGWVPPRRAMILCKFFFADKRRRDTDNLLARMKAVFDGLRDAGVIEDDVGFVHLPIEIDIDREDPRVEITITPLVE